MAKRFLKRYLPNQQRLQNSRWLKIFGKSLHKTNLWHFNRYSVAWGASIGLFVAYMPLPGHMIVAALLAILLRANLPVAILLVWVVNPVTFVPMFGFAYSIGAKLMGISVTHLHKESLFKIHDTLAPLMLGSLICGGTLAIFSHLFVRLFWRYRVSRNWNLRRKLRLPTDFDHEQPSES